MKVFMKSQVTDDSYPILTKLAPSQFYHKGVLQLWDCFSKKKHPITAMYRSK